MTGQVLFPELPDDIADLMESLAVEYCWSVIESAAVHEEQGEALWFNVGSDLGNLKDEFRLLTALDLAEVHPDHPDWIREVAEL